MADKALEALFEGRNPVVSKIHDALTKKLARFGPVRANAKKTSIHLVAKTGFAGVHPRKDSVLLNIRTAAPLKAKRVRKAEQVSANRWHNEILLSDATEIDDQLVGWLQEAHRL
jgi:hypothetical protein